MERWVAFKKRLFMKTKLSNEEYEFIIKEFAERIRDMVYGKRFKERLKKQFPIKECLEAIENKETATEICYQFTVCTGDVIQILNRFKRGEKIK